MVTQKEELEKIIKKQKQEVIDVENKCTDYYN